MTDSEMSINYIFYTLMESRRLYGKSVADAERSGLHFLRIFSLICYIEHRQERWAINSSRLTVKSSQTQSSVTVCITLELCSATNFSTFSLQVFLPYIYFLFLNLMLHQILIAFFISH